jgi:DNA polymerase elongation subunit (family B)
MIAYKDISNVLVIDIETVRGKKEFSDLEERFQTLWEQKSDQLQNRLDSDSRVSAEAYYDNSGIYAEFGKIVCISVGKFRKGKDGEDLYFRLKSFYGDDEKKLLEEFSSMLGQISAVKFCGHNIREFDLPYICRRMLINKVPLPGSLQFRSKKPWEIDELVLDTLNMWKFGDYKAYSSLKLLCAIFDIPTPKNDIDGSDVGRVYWEDKNLMRIESYCKKDVIATAQVYFALLGEDPFCFTVEEA